MSGEAAVGQEAISESPLHPGLLALLLRLQFEINCASSVAIEVPALRPYAKALQGV